MSQSLTGGGDTIDVAGGADTVYGLAGDDSILGGTGNDVLFGNADNDTLRGEANDDTLVGGLGNDLLDGGTGANIIYTGVSQSGGMYDDSVSDTVIGGGESDTIYGGVNDYLDGGLGTDRLFLPSGFSTIPSATSTLVGGYDTYSDTLGNSLYARGFESFSTYSPSPNPCFAAGTRIATARGEVAVEDLRVGDLVVTAGGRGALQPIVWIGHSQVNIAKHPTPDAVRPILIKAGALAEGVPFRDLRVSPDHALFLDGRLVPAALLVNGTTIVREEWCPAVTYWHVELPAHAVLLAEGAAAESYLDDGNRKHFDNGAIASLFKDFASERANGIYDRTVCYPVLRTGEALEAIRARLGTRADAAPKVARRQG